MARKDRTVAGFDKVSKDGVNEKTDDSNNNTNNNKKSILQEIQDENKSKNKTHTFKGYYLENEVANALDSHTSGGGRGVKSELVNRLLKAYLKQEGEL